MEALSEWEKKGIAVLIIKDLDLVLSEPTRGAQVKISGVFVAKGDVFNFCPLTPVSGSIRVLLAEIGFGERSKALLQVREVANLFKFVQEGDDSMAVDKVKRRKFAISGPSPGKTSDALKS
jgi:hypothetical protein